MRLISMREFVLEQRRLPITWNEYGIIVENYAHFLSQPLELWMFVPCGEDGEVLEEPENYHEWIKDGHRALKFTVSVNVINNEYRKAKERVLFEGIEFTYNKEKPILPTIYIKKEVIHNKGRGGFWFNTVEDLVKFNLNLTTTAIKQIGL